MGEETSKKIKSYDETYAWTLFNNAIENIEFPPNVLVNKKEDGSVSFFIMLSAHHGKATVLFTPNIQHVAEMLNSFRTTIETVVGTKMSAESAETSVAAVVYGIIKNLHIDLLEAFRDSAYLSALALSEMARKVLDRNHRQRPHESDSQSSNSENELSRTLDDYFAEKKERHKARLLSEVDINDFERPEKKLIDHFYSYYLPMWQEAKKCFRQNNRFENWREMVALAVPNLPSDLIDRLGDLDPYNSMPSSLALEQAARACGIPNNSLGIRALQNYLKESKEWAETVGTDEVESTLGRYIYRIQWEIFMQYRIADSMGKDEVPDFSNFSLMHQQIAPILHEAICETLRKSNETDVETDVH